MRHYAKFILDAGLIAAVFAAPALANEPDLSDCACQPEASYSGETGTIFIPRVDAGSAGLFENVEASVGRILDGEPGWNSCDCDSTATLVDNHLVIPRVNAGEEGLFENAEFTVIEILSLNVVGDDDLPNVALNDTGTDWCADGEHNFLECSVSSYPLQDGNAGRDPAHWDHCDGHAGFSFTKLDAAGRALPTSATRWSCVRDNVTGLVWEVKTNDGGVHDWNWTYSWYNPDALTNGGSAGMRDGGDCPVVEPSQSCDIQPAIEDTPSAAEMIQTVATGDEGLFDWNRIDSGDNQAESIDETVGDTQTADACADVNQFCDTRFYVQMVNAEGLCGLSDWRVPSKNELLSLVANIPLQAKIDPAFFPYTQPASFWSASPYAFYSDYAWYIAFDHGNANASFKSGPRHLRLVHNWR